MHGRCAAPKEASTLGAQAWPSGRTAGLGGVQCNSKGCNFTGPQGVLEVVRADLGGFDAVCMATALHALASLRAAPQAYADLFERASARALMRHIGAPSGPAAVPCPACWEHDTFAWAPGCCMHVGHHCCVHAGANV